MIEIRSKLVLKAEFDRGEVDKVTFDREPDRLTKAYRGALDSTKTLDRYCQADKPSRILSTGRVSPVRDWGDGWVLPVDRADIETTADRCILTLN